MSTDNLIFALGLTLFAGLSTGVGSLMSFMSKSFSPKFLAGALGFSSVVSGIMVYISLDELLPTAEEYGEHHIAIGGLIAGMLVMAVSLLLFA